MYKEIFGEEVGKKARSIATTPPADNYVFNYVRNSHPDFHTEWMDKKKLAVQKTKSIDGFTSKEAKTWGKVEDDAAQALLARKAKSIRELTRGEFRKDLATHYGIRSKIPAGQAKQRGLTMISKEKYPELYKGLGPGESLYIDEGIEKIYNNFVNLTSAKQTAEANDFIRAIDKVTNIFKTANTIYWPGFHIRNAVSDMFMGALDGVKSTRYSQVAKAMLNRDKAFLKVGNESVPYNRIYDSYYDNAASSGFFDSDLKTRVGKEDLATTGFMDAIRSPRAFTNKARELSTAREDFGRFVHYYHALDEEYANLIRKGMGKDKAWKGAEEAALSRVNKYKFDYNALTKSELALRKYGVPFYTYMRKAVPVLVENLFMNPKYFSYINRLEEALAPSEEFKGASLPSWMQELSYSQLTGGDEPIGFTDQLFPTRTLQEVFSNPLSKINPVAQGLVEYWGGEDLFTGRPVEGNFVEKVSGILKNKWRGVSTYRSIESDTKPTIEKWAGLFGIPLVQVTKARQNGKIKELEHDLSDKVTQINNNLAKKGLKLSVRQNKIYVIKPKSPTPDEIRFDQKPKYPVNEKEIILGVYETFDEIPKL